MKKYALIQISVFSAMFIGSALLLGASGGSASCTPGTPNCPLQGGAIPPPALPKASNPVAGRITAPPPSAPPVLSSNYDNKLSQAQAQKPVDSNATPQHRPTFSTVPPVQKAPVPVPARPPVTVPPGPTNVNTKTGASQSEASPQIPFVEYAEQSPSTFSDVPAGSIVKVSPEKTAHVQLSSSDINRIVCPAEIKDVNFSKEKGLLVKLQDNNAYLKFVVMKKDGKDLYSTTPAEVFITCDGSVYNIIAIPRRIPSQTVHLSPGDKSKKQQALFDNGVPFEKKIISIIKRVYTGNLPDNITEKKIDKSFSVFQDINLILHRLYLIDEENLRVKEYRATIAANAKNQSVYLKEKDFLKSELATKPVGVSIDILNLKKGGTSRIFVIERYDGGQS